MAIDTNATFVDALRQSGLLGVDQFNELRNLIARYPDSKALAGQLIQLGWLTPYQVNQLFQGQGNGLVLGQYRILERLGEGGMGQVFKARHQALGRIVALKVIRRDRLQSNEAVKRFRREMQMAGQLSHPNVVNAFDADAINGTHFFAMEFVDGTDLSRLVREKGPLPSHRACDCIRQAALGLQHAHEKGMVHRDIKPANLLVSKTPSGIVIKILDMGLARFQATEQEDQTMLSQDGHVLGTPDFMAPEQAKSSSTVDHRADIYSLGCTFYYLLVGKPPFFGGSNIEKLLKHQMDPPPPIEKFRSDVPEGVRLVLRQMLAKKPDERIQTAGTVAAALEPYCKPGSGLHLDKLITRPPVPVAEPITPNNTQSPTLAGRKRPAWSLTEQLSLAGSSRKRLIAIGASVGVFLLGLFVLILLLASGGGSSKTSPAVASSPTTAAPTQPDTRKTPTTEKKPPLIEPVGRFLFPETAVVLSFNMAQMRKSEVFRRHEDKVKELIRPFGVVNETFGDGFLLDAERVVLAMSPDDERRYLLIYQGALDASRFKTFATRLQAKTFSPRDVGQIEFYDIGDPTDRNNRLYCAFVTPSTFLMSPNMAYVVGGARRYLQNDTRLNSSEIQMAVERLDERTSLTLLVGGQVLFMGPMQEKSTLQQAAHIKLIRGYLLMGPGIQSEFYFTATDADSVDFVEGFPAHLRGMLRKSNNELGDLIDAMFEKPVRGPNNTISIRGRLNPKQVNRLFELTGRKN
jgi:serine/threonine protein kinase